MSDIEQLEQEILQDAQNKANEILDKAKKEADLIYQQAQKKKEELIEKLNKEIIDEQETEIQRELSHIRIRNKIQIENIKESLIQEIIDNSMEQIQKMREKKDQRYLSALKTLIISSGTVLEGEDLTVMVHSDDISSIDKKLIESEITKQSGNETRIKLSSPESNTINGGVMLYKGPLAVDNTFEAIFDRRKEIIRNELNSLLFQEDS